MTFTSFHFVVFFLITLVVGHALKNRSQRIFLLIASYYFYGVYEPAYLWLILLSSFYDYFAALGIAAHRAVKNGQGDSSWTRHLAFFNPRIWLSISMVLNLSLLFYFKYTNFGIEFLNDVSPLGGTAFGWPTTYILLPIGISFYTFQSMSYTIDVYRADLEARRDLIDFFLYVSFFPQLVAGPIVRASTFFKNLDARLKIGTNDVVVGTTRIIVGLFRKLVLADNMGVFVDQAFNNYAMLSPAEVWLASFGFGFQIYFDFAGYTDIARGVARLFGFEFNINFLYPMAAGNISEHWQRWHLSLTTWIRDYVYIPLGGSRVGPMRYYFNFIIIWVLTGIWHGPAYHFIVWGFWQAAMMIMHRFYTRSRLASFLNSLPAKPARTLRWLGYGYMGLARVVMLFGLFFGFIYFRADTMAMAHSMFGRAFGAFDFNAVLVHLFSFDFSAMAGAWTLPPDHTGFPISFSPYWILLIILFIYEYAMDKLQLEYFWQEDHRGRLVLMLNLMIFAVIIFGLSEPPSFKYFAF